MLHHVMGLVSDPSSRVFQSQSICRRHRRAHDSLVQGCALCRGLARSTDGATLQVLKRTSLPRARGRVAALEQLDGGAYAAYRPLDARARAAAVVGREELRVVEAPRAIVRGEGVLPGFGLGFGFGFGFGLGLGLGSELG